MKSGNGAGRQQGGTSRNGTSTGWDVNEAVGMRRGVNDVRTRWDANGMEARYEDADEEWCFYALVFILTSDMTGIYSRCVSSIYHVSNMCTDVYPTPNLKAVLSCSTQSVLIYI